MNPMSVLRRFPLDAISVAKAVAVLAVAAAAARFAVPYSIDAFSSVVPRLWSSVRFWLVPPYLFVTVHLIIVVIWKLSDQTLHKNPNPTDKQSSEALKPRDLPLDREATPLVAAAAAAEGTGESADISPISAARSAESCVTTDSEENSAVSSRFDLEKTEEDEGVDLVDAWQAIMKKSATWERSSATAAVAAAAGEERSVTFVEPSLAVDGNDELNRKFEAFIKKNYDQIRSY